MTAPSEIAHKVDHLFFWVVTICTFVFLCIIIAMIYLGYKYRVGAKVDRANPPRSHLGLELAWTLPTLIVFILFFINGANLYTKSKAPIDTDMEVYVIAKQWMWKFQHTEGHHEINELHLPLGKKIKLTMLSEDVIHSFFLPDFRIKQDLLPGRYTTLMLKPQKEGVFRIYCSEYCGSKHAQMLGRVIVMNNPSFEKWKLAQRPWPGKITSSRGQKLFNDYGCIACHSTRPSDVLDQDMAGPSLWNIYNKKVTLTDGKTIVADESYIHRAVYEPNAMIVKGFKPQMPTFKGIITNEEFQDILGFLKTLKSEKKP